MVAVGKIFDFREVLLQLYNVIVRRQFKFTFELIPYEVKDLRWKKIFNLFLHAMNQYLLPSKPLGIPVIAQVEPANVCDLECPLCLTTSLTSARVKGVLSFDTFKKFVDDIGDYLLLIVLWNWGEPFLNHHLIKMIEYAKEKNIALHCSTHGNFLNFDEAKAERLVDSGLDTLIFGVDGATQETYSQYRRGGNLHKVLDNIRTIVRIKKAKGAAHPRLTLRFVVMRHNEHETPLMHKLAEELEVDFLSFKTVNMPLPHGESLDSSWSPESKRYQRYEYHTESHARKQRPFRCMRPWKRITLQARGEIISCDQDYKNTYTFGNINDGQSTRAIWKNGIAAAFRKTFNLGWNGYYHCQDCQYKDQVAGDSTIEITPLKP